MGTLAAELSDELNRLGCGPRMYIDANVPVGLVRFMRRHLGWDVLLVMEHDELPRCVMRNTIDTHDSGVAPWCRLIVTMLMIAGLLRLRVVGWWSCRHPVITLSGSY